jgi:hypothetical protein
VDVAEKRWSDPPMSKGAGENSILKAARRKSKKEGPGKTKGFYTQRNTVDIQSLITVGNTSGLLTVLLIILKTAKIAGNFKSLGYNYYITVMSREKNKPKSPIKRCKHHPVTLITFGSPGKITQCSICGVLMEDGNIFEVDLVNFKDGYKNK